MVASRFIYFTAPKLIKNANGSKQLHPYCPKWMKDKFNKELYSREHYESICDPTHKVKCVLTGKINNITVFDFDSQEIYWDTMARFPHLKGCYTVKTSKGFHIYTKYNPCYKTTTNKEALIDVRNDAALAYGVGTKTEFGTEYLLFYDGLLDIEAPQELYDLAVTKSNKAKSNDVNSIKMELQESNHSQSFEERIVELIDVQFLENRDSWSKIMWALRNEGFVSEFAKRISKKAPNYTEEGFDNVWDYHGKSSLTMGTLKHYARLSNESKYLRLHAQRDSKMHIICNDYTIALKFDELMGDDLVSKLHPLFVFPQKVARRPEVRAIEARVYEEDGGLLLERY